jgi:signal transduction histidine kinase
MSSRVSDQHYATHLAEIETTPIGDALHSMGACGHTLLDVIDHLLDYSKVNQLNKSKSRPSKARKDRDPDRRGLFHSMLAGQTYNVDIANLVEESIDSMFAGHNYKMMALSRASKAERVAKNNFPGLDKANFENVQPSDGQEEGTVTPYLCIAPATAWRSHTQPGALRRIVMNALGNALKYTKTGFISIDLRRHEQPTKPGRSLQQIKLTIIDSGRGMSQEFLKTRLFNAFAQEDTLDSGTGLGMGLVQQITKQLGGSVRVQSRANYGTAVVVTLPFVDPTDEAPPGPLGAYADQLKGLRVSLRGFQNEAATIHLSGRWVLPEAQSIATMCREWLHLEVIQDEGDVCADLIICSDRHMDEIAKQASNDIMLPVLVICRDALTARRRLAMQEGASEGNVYEFISMPSVFPLPPNYQLNKANRSPELALVR